MAFELQGRETILKGLKRSIDGFDRRSSRIRRQLTRTGGLNVMITDPTGVDKTCLACALGHKACRDRHSARYIRLTRLLHNAYKICQRGESMRKLQARWTTTTPSDQACASLVATLRWMAALLRSGWQPLAVYALLASVRAFGIVARLKYSVCSAAW